jgi:hypothetical protein
MAVEDGGQAFPVPLAARANGMLDAGEPGMTLRDWFAGQVAAAMAGGTIACGASSGPTDAVALAKGAYCVADALLSERSKGGN